MYKIDTHSISCQLKRKKLVSQPSLSDIKFQFHTSETTKWMALFLKNLQVQKALVLTTKLFKAELFGQYNICIELFKNPFTPFRETYFTKFEGVLFNLPFFTEFIFQKQHCIAFFYFNNYSMHATHTFNTFRFCHVFAGASGIIQYLCFKESPIMSYKVPIAVRQSQARFHDTTVSNCAIC